ncbi:hypothetical protein Ae201684P_006608 [Aphanomyces euteiches]|uniref:Uncharacterized protein n=1 Tax=Aphanomyces euteiches TaxID=100861 RepID=A0A6G0XAT5_9STRA|nr:hypothetical protein Ae201684_006443 [Aphanomyces euteiches]KAH9091208.1 hypothetical protein Ae201684P_006608 [Aphanomyces euteiches]KAH9146400.1 hypothetical protein AeRB84_009660 [Aphanomyces euteiches]
MLKEFTKLVVSKVEDANHEGASQSEDKPPGQHTHRIEVIFRSPPSNLSHITFQNYYVASLRIDQVINGRSDVILEKRSLMDDAHHEDDAQNWHIIKREELGSHFDSTSVEKLIFYLTQPSPLWEKWELRTLKVFETSEAIEVVPKALLAEKATTESSMHMYRKYTVNTSGVALDSKDISGHATRFMSLLALLQSKVTKEVK